MANDLKANILPKQIPVQEELSSSSSWVSHLGLLFLLINCIIAIYHSWNDPYTVAFVIASFVDLFLLFHFLRAFENVPPGSPKRAQTKVIIWCLSTILTIMFSYRVAALMPLPVAAIVWGMSGSTILAGFWMFFICRDEEVIDDEEPIKVVTQDP